MEIITYSMGTLLCLLFIYLAVGAWQDFTGERRERRTRIELEARVNSQQDKIDELQKRLAEFVRLLDEWRNLYFGER